MEIRDAKLEFAYNPGVRPSTEYIILHHAAADGSAEDVHRYHRDTNGWAGIAYHFYVDKLGGVTKGRELEWSGGHTSGYHYNSVGVCFEGNFERDTMSEAQKAAGKELVRYLHSVYPDAKIVSHGELNATACPGANFPLAFMRNVTEEASEWAKEAVEKWKALGVLLGDGNGNFGLQEPVTLERMIVLIERRMEV